MRLNLARAFMLDPENWRVDMLTLVLRVALLFGAVVYGPSVYFALRDGFVSLAIADTAALVIVIGLLHSPRLSYVRRAVLFSLVSYMLGVGLLIAVGPISQIYLFGFAILATLLLGLRAGLAAVALGSLTLLLLGTDGIASPVMTNAAEAGNFVAWLVMTLNFTLVNLTMTVGIGLVLSALESALKRETTGRLALDAEREVLRTLVDALPDVVFTKDVNACFVRGNPATQALMGLHSESELLGKSVHDLFPRDVAEASHADDLRVLAGGRVLNREERSLDAQGNAIWYLTNKIPLYSAGGAIVGLIGMSRDITERKKVEMERDHLLDQLQIQIDRMPLAYALTDGDLRFTRWNPAAEEMFGFSESEALGKHPFDLIVPSHSRQFVSEIFAKIQVGNMDAHGVSWNITKSGKPIRCEWHNTPFFDQHGAFTGLLSLAQDVTDRTKLEDQLRQAHKMEAVGLLAGGIAHDFNNLLTIILASGDMLLESVNVDAFVHESATDIRDAALRAATLTRQLLAFSRQSILQPKVLDLNPVIVATSSMLRRLIGEDILFTTVLEPVVHRVRVDPGQLDQVLMNLAVNARDAMPQGGRLTIETSNVELSDDYAAKHPGATAGRHVMLAVSDTGVGMTSEVIDHIFEPFFTTKDVGRGTGLGLAMVFGVVEQNGGSIHVYSEVGIGSTFKIYFPAIEEESAQERDVSTTADLRGTETILLVEDESIVARLAAENLRSRGYTVLTATDGRNALRVFEEFEGKIHLLLTDVVMPHSSGPQLASTLRLSDPLIKVLYMSGYTDDTVVRHGLLQADVSFVQKPYSSLDLARKVRLVLDEKSLVGASQS